MSPHGRIPKFLDLKNKNELEEYLGISMDEGFQEEGEYEEDRLSEEEE